MAVLLGDFFEDEVINIQTVTPRCQHVMYSRKKNQTFHIFSKLSKGCAVKKKKKKPFLSLNNLKTSGCSSSTEERFPLVKMKFAFTASELET